MFLSNKESDGNGLESSAKPCPKLTLHAEKFHAKATGNARYQSIEDQARGNS
jgi:hypothetical protein